MKVILMDDVVGVGDIGETVKVRPGFARNFLIPRGYAVEFDAKSAKVVAHRMMQVEAKKKRLKNAAGGLADQLRSVAIEFGLRVGSGGRVFGSITGRDIAAELQRLGYDIDRRRILLHEPIKKTGTHFVTVKLHPEVSTTVKVQVAELEASKEQSEQEVAAAQEALETAAEGRAAEEAEAAE